MTPEMPKFDTSEQYILNLARIAIANPKFAYNFGILFTMRMFKYAQNIVEEKENIK